jgi:hypothetical protein
MAPEPETVLPAEEARPPLDPAQLAAAQAISEAIGEKDFFTRAQRLATLLASLGPEGVPGARQVLEDPNLGLGGVEIELLARFWASHEPEAASRWAAERSPTGYRLSAILAAFPVWVAADPEAALAAEQEWEKQDAARDAVHIGLVRGWYARSPAELTDFIQTIGVGFARQRLLAILSRLMLQHEGPEALMRWAESIPDDDPDFKLDVYRQVAVALPAFDLAAAFRWCEAHGDGPYGGNLRSIVAMRWAEQGHERDALAWLGSAPPSTDRDSSLPGVFDRWIQRDPEAASAWIEARSAADDAEPWLPLLYWSYAVSRMPDSPAEAAGWAERVEDEAARERLLVWIARRWRALDEPAAEAWLIQSPLSEAARERARKPLGAKRSEDQPPAE